LEANAGTTICTKVCKNDPSCSDLVMKMKHNLCELMGGVIGMALGGKVQRDPRGIQWRDPRMTREVWQRHDPQPGTGEEDAVEEGLPLDKVVLSKVQFKLDVVGDVV
jgi:hypothetical protein